MVNVKCFNDNMNELHVIESKRKAIRKGFAFELMNAQDAVLCSRLHASHAGPTSTFFWKLTWCCEVLACMHLMQVRRVHRLHRSLVFVGCL